MEHRIGSRRASNIFVIVSQFGIALGKYPVHNLGAGGMAIRGNIGNLAIHSLVRVQLYFGEHSGDCIVETKALVVHQNNDITGVMWAEYDHAPAIATRTRPQTAVHMQELR
jgi:hypothetical protein